MAITSPRAASVNRFLDVPINYENETEHRRLLAEAVNSVRNGKVRSTGTVTLEASQTTTTLTDIRIGPESVILFMPTTQNAAGEVGYYVSARTEGQATITHATDSRTDRTFAYVVLG